jgi:hypothetical protein
VAKTAPKKAPTVVTITKPWQIVFIDAVVGSQIAWYLIVFWPYVRRHGNAEMDGASWIWLLSNALYPLLYVAVSYLFVRRRVIGAIPTAFWALFLATIGCLGYNAVMTIISWLRIDDQRYAVIHDTGLWSLYGWHWSVMAVIFAIFTVALMGVARKPIKK